MNKEPLREAPYTSGIQDIGIADIAQRLWSARRVFVASIAVLGFLALIYLQIGQRYYSSTTVVGPNLNSVANSSSGNPLLSTLASVTGHATSGEYPAFTQFSALVTSKRAAAQLLKHQELMHRVFHTMWDADRKIWREPQDIPHFFIGVVRVILNLPQWEAPNPEKVSNYLQKNVAVATDDSTGYVTLAFEFPDATTARDFVATLVHETDEMLRQDAKTYSARQIALINAKLPHVNNEGDRTALTNVLSAQEQTALLAATSPYYSIQMLDPAVVSKIPTWPNMLVIAGVIFFLSFVTMVLFAFTRVGKFYVVRKIDDFLTGYARKARKRLAAARSR